MMNQIDWNDPEQVGPWLEQRRWYGEKGRRLVAADPRFTTTAQTDGEAITVTVLHLQFAAGPDADYLLIRDPAQPDTDGVESENVRSWLMQSLIDGQELADGHGGSLLFTPEDELDQYRERLSHVSSRMFRGEQSNTSVVYGDAGMLKIFRKIRQGENPEVEIGTFLTRETRFNAFPRLLGTIDLEVDGAVSTLAALQQFIPSVGDAWSWITERITDASVRPTTVDGARQLGIRTGEMHIALASGTSEAFVPEQVTSSYAEAVRAEAIAELRDTILQLQERGVAGARELGDAIGTSLDAFRAIDGTMITRVHGDYHLGQVLRTSVGDFAILDFEGEPTRALSERRAKASPLRDVAGMLRSFDYAAETARRTAGGGDPHSIDAWYEASRAAFMEGYNDTVGSDPTLMHGWDPITRQAALAAFEVHKALYEVRYELGNRPDWLDIPLNALRRIARDAD